MSKPLAIAYHRAPYVYSLGYFAGSFLAMLYCIIVACSSMALKLLSMKFAVIRRIFSATLDIAVLPWVLVSKKWPTLVTVVIGLGVILAIFLSYVAEPGVGIIDHSIEPWEHFYTTDLEESVGLTSSQRYTHTGEESAKVRSQIMSCSEN